MNTWLNLFRKPHIYKLTLCNRRAVPWIKIIMAQTTTKYINYYMFCREVVENMLNSTSTVLLLIHQYKQKRSKQQVPMNQDWMLYKQYKHYCIYVMFLLILTCCSTIQLIINTINYQLVERIIGRCSQFSTTHNYSCPDLIPILLVPVVFDCTKKQRNYGYVVAILQMVGYDLVYLLVLHHTYNPSIISFTNRCRIHMLSKFHHYCYHTSSSLLYCNYMMIHMCRCFCCKYHSCCFCSGVVAIWQSNIRSITIHRCYHNFCCIMDRCCGCFAIIVVIKPVLVVVVVLLVVMAVALSS